ncbi:hypothetical protein DdX_18037 [Ditylenchus destructor]|uniref:Uncharacterized protein n=1 Tax=Ditylenchus destructor TaxID=166010 RepID=A0AAD4MQV1_9BILA|nr:hypothetical protein DdX_18037 [Ditylenchus destructor]
MAYLKEHAQLLRINKATKAMSEKADSPKQNGSIKRKSGKSNNEDGSKIANKDYPAASPHGGAHGHPGFSEFPEAINPGTRKCCLRDRYQSTQLAETKRLTYHTPGSEPRRVICDLAKSRIFRISGSHKSRYSQMLPARPVPIDSARRDEAIDVSHARIRAPTRDL